MGSDAANIIARFEALKSHRDFQEIQLDGLKTEVELLTKAKKFLIEFSEFSREKVKAKLENLVNSALKSVFTDKEIIFKIIPNRTKIGVVYNLYVETSGALTPVMNARGGGVVDIISLALRISFLRLFSSKLRQTMILDEPFKNLDTERLNSAIQWLKLISQEFQIQFIVVTHIPFLIDVADASFEVKLVNDISEIRK